MKNLFRTPRLLSERINDFNKLDSGLVNLVQRSGRLFRNKSESELVIQTQMLNLDGEVQIVTIRLKEELGEEDAFVSDVWDGRIRKSFYLATQQKDNNREPETCDWITISRLSLVGSSDDNSHAWGSWVRRKGISAQPDFFSPQSIINPPISLNDVQVIEEIITLFEKEF